MENIEVIRTLFKFQQEQIGVTVRGRNNHGVIRRRNYDAVVGVHLDVLVAKLQSVPLHNGELKGLEPYGLCPLVGVQTCGVC